MATAQYLRMRISENNGLPWDQTQDFVNLCRTISRLGDPTAYSPAHPPGSSPTDTTQFQVGLAHSNINNLPDVFYQLWPSKEWWDHTKSAKPVPKRDANGRIMLERSPRSWAPRELLDFPILKDLDRISSEAEAWFLELLMRMDGRIEWTDLLMRMEYSGFSELDEQKFRNRLQQRMARLREKFAMVSWKDTAGNNNAIRDRVLNKLSPAQLAARGGLGSTNGSTPGSRDSQGSIIPVPGRRTRGTANAMNAAAHKRQLQIQVAHVGPSNTAPRRQLPIASTSFSAVNSHPSQPLATYAGNGFTQEIQSPVSFTGSSASHYLRHHTTPAGPLSNEYVQAVTSQGASAAWQRSPQLSYPPSSDEDVEDCESDEASEDCEADDESDENDERKESEENDNEMPLAEVDHRKNPMTTDERREWKRYLEEEHIRATMCVYGDISVEKLVSDMARNEAKLRSGLKRAEAKISDADGVEDIQDRRAKRTRRGEDAARPSDEPLFGSQGLAYSSFDRSQPGPWGEYNRQGASAHTSRRPTTRPVGSAVQRLHNDRSRRPAPKATVVQNGPSESLYYPQPNIPTDDYGYQINNYQKQSHLPPYDPQKENSLGFQHGCMNVEQWQPGLSTHQPQPEVAKGDHDSQSYHVQAETSQSPYHLQEASGAQNGYDCTNSDQPQGHISSHHTQPENDGMGNGSPQTNTGDSQPQSTTDLPQSGNALGNSNVYTNTREAQPRPSSHRQRQPGSERTSSAINPILKESTCDRRAYPHSRPKSYDSYDSRSPSSSVEPSRNGAHTVSRPTHQHPTASTVQDDPFFSDELFNGMLNGQPDANHVGSMYTRSYQREIDDYYQRLMAPRPRAESGSDAPEDVTPPPLHSRQEEPETVFLADLLNPHSRPQARHGGNAPRFPRVPSGVPKPPEQSDDDLNVGDFSLWGAEWSAFINDHDNMPLLQGHYPDEYREGSVPRRPPQ
ncbi:MAG: hypothetical protein ASARMPREDX12_007992 [Alectoria sarmentosa]|nr:MAG: hypothetical protein ASARMPREDX12_007992 [Alectoria sarmentosa]